MADLVVELHVPLVPEPGVPLGAAAFPWVFEVQEAMAWLELEKDGAVDYDEPEESHGHYVYFLTGNDETRVIEAASAVAKAQRLPPGAFLVVTDTDSPYFGHGRREELR